MVASPFPSNLQATCLSASLLACIFSPLRRARKLSLKSDQGVALQMHLSGGGEGEGMPFSYFSFSAFLLPLLFRCLEPGSLPLRWGMVASCIHGFPLSLVSILSYPVCLLFSFP